MCARAFIADAAVAAIGKDAISTDTGGVELLPFVCNKGFKILVRYGVCFADREALAQVPFWTDA